MKLTLTRKIDITDKNDYVVKFWFEALTEFAKDMPDGYELWEYDDIEFLSGHAGFCIVDPVTKSIIKYHITMMS